MNKLAEPSGDEFLGALACRAQPAVEQGANQSSDAAAVAAQSAANAGEAPSYLATHVSTKQRGSKFILTLELDGVEPAPRYKVTPVNPAVVRKPALVKLGLGMGFDFADALAQSMIPAGGDEAYEWNEYAKTLVASVLRQLTVRKMLSIKKLLHYVQVASLDELRELLVGTPAATLFASTSMVVSVRSLAAQHVTTHVMEVFDDLLRLQRDFAAPGDTKPEVGIMRKLQSAGFKLAAGAVEKLFEREEFPPVEHVEIRQPLPAAMRARTSPKKHAKKLVNTWMDKRDIKLKRKARKDLRERIAAVMKDAR